MRGDRHLQDALLYGLLTVNVLPLPMNADDDDEGVSPLTLVVGEDTALLPQPMTKTLQLGDK